MSNYLRNVAHRAAGASLLRPRIPSRFEPVAGMGPAMSDFREVVTERVTEAPRATQVKETRLPPPPVLPRAVEPQVRHEEPRAATPPVITQIAGERAVSRKKPEIEQPHPLQQARIQNDPLPTQQTPPHGLRPEVTPISREVVAENAQPRQESMRPPIQMDVPVAVPSAAKQFPAPASERRGPPVRPEQRTPPAKAELQIRTPEVPVTAARAAYEQPARPQAEIAAPSIHVTIGKVTVQASLPAPVHAQPRTPAHTSPRLTLERYLDRRGGRP